MSRAKPDPLAKAGDGWCVPIPLDTERYKELEANEFRKAKRAFCFMIFSLLAILAVFFALVEFALPALQDYSGKITIVFIFSRIIIWFLFRI